MPTCNNVKCLLVTFSVLSELPLTTSLLSDDQLTWYTGRTWPLKVVTKVPLMPSHSLTDLSKEALTIQRPSGENWTCSHEDNCCSPVLCMPSLCHKWWHSVKSVGDMCDDCQQLTSDASGSCRLTSCQGMPLEWGHNLFRVFAHVHHASCLPVRR